MARILLLYASVEGQTARVAGRIAEILREAGHAVEPREASHGAQSPRLGDYDAVMVGASVHYGRHPAHLRRMLRRCRGALQNRRSAFFSVSLSASEQYGADFLRGVGWQPALVASFAGALRYSRYGWFKRHLVRAFARMGGHGTDASRDYEYTDWSSVAHFAEAFAQCLAARA
jgi:menaquinone-dependent protoporphyrinogen oxidase